MVWLWSKLRLRRSDPRARTRARSASGYPRGSWEPLFAALAGSVRGGGRPGAARPARRRGWPAPATGSASCPGAPDSFRRGHDPRAFAAADGEGEDYDARARHRAERHLRARCSTRRSPPRSAGPTSTACAAVEYAAALCLLLELDRPFSAFYWTNVGDRALPFVGPDRADELRRAGALRRPALPLRGELPPARPPAPRPRRRRRCSPRYEPGLRAVNPAFARAWVRHAWRFVEPAAQPIVTVGYADRLPPLRTPGAAGSCSPTRPRCIPRTAARTTPSGSAARPRGPC